MRNQIFHVRVAKKKRRGKGCCIKIRNTYTSFHRDASLGVSWAAGSEDHGARDLKIGLQVRGSRVLLDSFAGIVNPVLK